jgi:4-phospho-D-threonate 3-dehydrogenase / 4-phospho-D-erythronate 3-dehydrogenase
MANKEKPIVVITMGEASGIGPEIMMRAIAKPAIFDHCRPLFIGDYTVMKMVGDELGIRGKIRRVDKVDGETWDSDTASMIDLNNIPPNSFMMGRPNAVTGKAMIEYSEFAIRLCMERKVHGAVGGPHSKKAADDAGIPFNGYPGLVGRLTGSRYPFLMLVAGRLRVTNVTLHISMRKALDLIRKDLILEAIKATHEAVGTFGVSAPRIAVAGLNPHAGEGGMFGDEDDSEIGPAVREAKRLGLDVVGPLPADSLFWKCADDKYDAYVAMYHDQAHIPVKVLAFMSASAVAIGVPINWATVDHGCASDIAWKGVADPGALIETIKLVSGRRI